MRSMARAILLAALTAFSLGAKADWTSTERSLCANSTEPLFLFRDLTLASSGHQFIAGVPGYNPYSMVASAAGNSIEVTLKAANIPGAPPPLSCQYISIDPLPVGVYTVVFKLDDFTAAPALRNRVIATKKLEVISSVLPLASCSVEAEQPLSFAVLPTRAKSSESIRVVAGRSSYDPIALRASVQGNTIDLTFAASYIGFIPPPTSCLELFVDPLPSGLYKVNLWLYDLGAERPKPLLMDSKVLEVDGPPAVLSGLWWNASESGWGINLTQRHNNVFATWFTYDSVGAPKWYVAPHCQLPSTGASGNCIETLYEVNGPKFFGTAFNPAATQVKDVGTMELGFVDENTGSMKYTVAGQTRSVPITRQPISSGAALPVINYTDLWWNPDESGWGMAVTHQANTMFLALFVYDSAGAPVWYVASNCTVKASPDGCDGTLYRTSGPALGPTFDSSKVQVTAVGSVSLSFPDANNASLSYTVDGMSSSKAIKRQVF